MGIETPYLGSSIIGKLVLVLKVLEMEMWKVDKKDIWELKRKPIGEEAEWKGNLASWGFVL